MSNEIKLIVDSEFKTCSKCLKTFPATDEYFYKQLNRTKTKGTFYKLSSWCKECSINKSTEWQQSIDPERRRKYFRKCDSSERRKKIKREHSRKRKDEGKEKEWKQNNRDKIKIYNFKRKMNKEHDISEQEWLECLEFFNDSCAYCGISEKQVLIEQGQLLHKEHVDHNGANDITNCVPACRNCNSHKWEFELNDWYNETNPIYSKRRYNKIIKWLLSFSNNK